MITYMQNIKGYGQGLLRFLLCAALFTFHFSLFTFHFSLLTCAAQPALSLEAAIRQAQDSTIIAFQSQHEYDYYQLHYDEFTALRKPQLTLHAAPYYQKLISDPTRLCRYAGHLDRVFQFG